MKKQPTTLIAGLISLTHVSNVCAATNPPNEYRGAEYGADDTGKDIDILLLD